ncbi:hypothetical protein [Marinomonas rhodophyticola]|uniref:hypothetical protein n=1 Tax=Marinomonas rhodophyticola TaxID=2992803 RepID=UPI003D165A53
MSAVELPKVQKHTRLEDAQAVLLGTLIIALGVNLYTHTGLLTGVLGRIGFFDEVFNTFNFWPSIFLN